VSLTDRLQTDIKTAMRESDVPRRDTLRMVLASAQNAEKAKQAPLTSEEELAVLTREVKQRRESIEAFGQAGRDDLAAAEQAEIDVLMPYLPAQLDETELRALVQDAIATSGATSAREMGKVMGVLMPHIKGKADGKAVSAMVAQELAKADLAEHDDDDHVSGAQAES
jgi:uncharacterized protein YqeY